MRNNCLEEAKKQGYRFALFGDKVYLLVMISLLSTFVQEIYLIKGFQRI